jgi:hypothetical protein
MDTYAMGIRAHVAAPNPSAVRMRVRRDAINFALSTPKS